MRHLKWKQYIEDIKSGRIPSGLPIKQAVTRFEKFCKREDMYFDEACVDAAIDFIALMKHFLGKSAGKPFILEPFQEFVVANLLGIKWKSSGFRVCRETYIQVARKAGKDAFIAALNLYFLIADKEAAAELVCAANSTNQANILFKYIDEFAKSIDPKNDMIKHYRKYIAMPASKSKCEVISSDASKGDGKNVHCYTCDEYHEAKDRKMYDVLKSSQGMREQPMGIIITTAGFNLDSPCHDMYMYAKEVLAEIKDDPTFFPFIWELDEEDNWEDPKNWIKCQPNLGITVTEEFMAAEVLKAKNDATAMNGILTKTFNKWVSSMQVWIPQEMIAKSMKKIDLEDFRGYTCYMGVDLGSVNDLTSLSVMIPLGNKYYFKTYTFIPNETLKTHPNKELYKKFIDEGTLTITPGNVTDYDFIMNKMKEINEILPIQGVYYDKYNATQWAISCTEQGFNMIQYGQNIGNFNKPTKEFERLTREGAVQIDKSSNILWQFGNVVLKTDVNNNCKPIKEMSKKKIDSVISMLTSLGGYLQDPIVTDFTVVF